MTHVNVLAGLGEVPEPSPVSSGDEFPDYLAAELTELLEAAPMKIRQLVVIQTQRTAHFAALTVRCGITVILSRRKPPGQ